MLDGSTPISRAVVALILLRAQTLLASVAIVWVIVWFLGMAVVLYHCKPVPKAQPLRSVEYSVPAREPVQGSAPANEHSADREAAE
jgi:hypothetical protein